MMTPLPLASHSAQRAHPEVVTVNAPLGAEIRGLDLRQMDDATFRTVHAAWLDNVLLVFRGQSLNAQDLVSLVRRFGTPVSSTNLHKRNLDERAANKLYNRFAQPADSVPALADVALRARVIDFDTENSVPTAKGTVYVRMTDATLVLT